jgi:hypothetical protein
MRLANPLAVQIESATARFDKADAESGFEDVPVAQPRNQAIKVRMIEMPEPGVGQRDRDGCFLFKHDPAAIFLDDGDVDLSLAVNERRNPQRSGVRFQVRRGVHIHALDVIRGRRQQAHRTIDAAIVRPIARMAARQHVLVEAIICAHAHGVGRTPLQVRRDVQSECRVAFA